jgi:hypothetical protein
MQESPGFKSGERQRKSVKFTAQFYGGVDRQTEGEKCTGWWLVGWWSVYSCCSHMEHRASMKRFVSLQFFNLRHSVGLFGGVISPLQGCYLTQTQNKHKQTSMSLVGFEPTIPAFERASERAKTFHALDRAATVIGCLMNAYMKFR